MQAVVPALLPLHDCDGCCCLCCSGKEGNSGVKVVTEGKFEIGDANVGPHHWLQLLCFSCSNNRETGEKGRGSRREVVPAVHHASTRSNRHNAAAAPACPCVAARRNHRTACALSSTASNKMPKLN